MKIKKYFDSSLIEHIYLIAFLVPFLPFFITDITSISMMSLSNNIVKLYLVLTVILIAYLHPMEKSNYRYYVIYFVCLVVTYISRMYFSAIDPNFIIKDIILETMIPLSILLVHITIINIEKFRAPIVKIGKYLFLLLITSIIYGFLFDFVEIIKLFTGTKNYFVLYDSFYINRNSFAQFLFLGITQLIIFRKTIVTKTSHTIYRLTFLFSVVSLLITLSRTALISTLIFSALYLIINHVDIKNFKKFLFIVLSGILIIVILEVVVFYIFDFSIVSKVLRLEFGLAGRANLWKIAVEAFDKNRIFGVGMLNARSLLYYYNNVNTQFHNMFFEHLAANGLVGITMQTVAFCYFVRIIYKKLSLVGKKNAITYVSLIVTIFFYSLSESINIFGLSYVSMLFTSIIFLLPLIYEGGSQQNEKNID